MLKKIAIGFGLLVLIALIKVAVIYGGYLSSKAANDRDAIKNVNEQHAVADIEGDRLFRSRISSLQQLGILGEKVAESKADNCYIEANCVGFGCQSWEQFCRLDYVAGYAALLSRDETFDRIEIASLRKEDPTFPTRYHPSNRSGCRYSAGRSNNITYVPAGSIPEGEDCRIPEPVSGMKPRGERKPGSTKFDYTFDPDAIDQSVDLLWTTYTHRYYRENLVCRPGLLSGCGPSRSTAIQAD
jgi:hypothetical protein